MSKDQIVIILVLYICFALLYTVGDWLSCYYMISGGPSWCEPIVELFGL